ncbi:hypothetical protein [Herbaspirillum chlorophenolicum]|uniref:hypothetical protein n=1 Tax=Herbaspirillum chlorophenolicum TaxID=211589 RepID=UPI0014721CDE|nr:hypothetical protein [Herbaspirillum chlorophenolicum]
MTAPQHTLSPGVLRVGARGRGVLLVSTYSENEQRFTIRHQIFHLKIVCQTVFALLPWNRFQKIQTIEQPGTQEAQIDR